MSRILVMGNYNENNEYVLRLMDGTIFKTLKEGDHFRVGNQMREWYVIRKGRTLFCEKNGELVKLPEGKKGLWATSSGAARNGLFHWYHEPADEIEKAVQDRRSSAKVIKYVDEIEWTGSVGGQLCHHCVRNWGTIDVGDGEEEDITEPPVVTDHDNQYHIGCLDGTYMVHWKGGNYLAIFAVHTTMNGSRVNTLTELLIKKGISEEKKAELIDLLRNGD